MIIKYEENGTKYTETMIHHTAIIYEVYNSDIKTLTFLVGLSTLNLNYLKGKIMIYRPIL